jgi:hypothetical protein
VLRAFKTKHIDEDFPEVPPPTNGAEYYDCTFHKLGGATLANCSLSGCKFAMTDPRDILGLTVTMDCFTFENLEVTEEVFDALLLLICKTKGNTKKRLAIIEDIVGHDNSVRILNELSHMER